MKHFITAALLALASPAVACDLIPEDGAILIGSAGPARVLAEKWSQFVTGQSASVVDLRGRQV